MTDLNYLHLSSRCVLKISGEESRDFLQGLVSNDLDRVSESQAIYAALLTPQGKYLHDFFIVEIAGCLYLDCEAARIDDLFKRLRMFKMRAKIELEILEDWAVAVLFSGNAFAALEIRDTAGTAKKLGDGCIYTDPRNNAIGARAILPKASLEPTLIEQGFSVGALEEYESLRLALGLPDSSRDMAVDKSTLLESGFEELNGVDFNKGCYIGQELTARTKHRGLVKKRLIPVQIAGESPPSGTEITQDGKNAGELRSTTHTEKNAGIGLALLRLEVLENSTPLLANDVTLTPHKPSWMNF